MVPLGAATHCAPGRCRVQVPLVCRINAPRIVHETVDDTVDDEVVAIDFETGTYYSVTGSGAVVWACLERGASARSIVDQLAGTFDGDRTLLESSATSTPRAARAIVFELPVSTWTSTVQPGLYD